MRLVWLVSLIVWRISPPPPLRNSCLRPCGGGGYTGRGYVRLGTPGVWVTTNRISNRTLSITSRSPAVAILVPPQLTAIRSDQSPSSAETQWPCPVRGPRWKAGGGGGGPSTSGPCCHHLLRKDYPLLP